MVYYLSLQNANPHAVMLNQTSTWINTTQHQVSIILYKPVYSSLFIFNTTYIFLPYLLKSSVASHKIQIKVRHIK